VPVIRFLLEGRAEPHVAVAPEGTTLLEAARRSGVLIESPCNGAGTCGKCKVRVDAAGSLRQTGPRRLPEEEEALGWTLSCHAEVWGDATVGIPAGKREGLKILSHGVAVDVGLSPFIRKAFDPDGRNTIVFAGKEELGREPGDTTAALYGVVVDIGTTTLVTSLVNLLTGEEIGSESALNPQALHAQDVLSRIKLGSGPEGLAQLQGEVVGAINEMIGSIEERTGVPRGRIYEAVFSGNTTMLHLAAGVDPKSLGKYPYTPAWSGDHQVRAADIGLCISEFGNVYLPPILSAYVGADITSGVLATRLHREEGVTLFVDIGTNGEMVLAVDGRLTATSTAAGPAFEGMNITCGMRASEGAVEAFQAEGEGLSIRTIGDATPVGLCGSGLVDLVGELAAHGVVDRNGRFAKPAEPMPPALRERLVLREEKPVFQVAGPVYLTQKDVRQVQLAKGAVRAGIDLLLKAEGLGAAAVDRVLIAGSFGYHLRTRSLVNLGLLPEVFIDRVEFVGNTSKTGGHAFLIHEQSRKELDRLAREVKILELANDPEFEKTFIAALAFPSFVPGGDRPERGETSRLDHVAADSRVAP
jgi:uncharacterized 2Fe-2S/4Fe-4S cluster protein (DUF4445 family)